MRIGILLFDGVDLLDAGGPYEVFLTASRLAGRDGDPAPFEVVTFTVDGAPVTAYGGMGLVPGASAADVGALDVVIVPGTIDLTALLADAALLDTIRSLASGSPITTSVCTGAFLLAGAGVLTDQPWTTHWEDVDDLAARLGPAGATRGVRWVDAGDVVTAAGLSSGIAMALHLVDRLAGRDLAERTARQIDYEWAPEGTGSVVPTPS
ncbi:MAG: DJ-1/PfpI family protein [Actinomycetota bacterium]|nr:DJ-1/PfpI family protein [Actinomycetota bacterium]